MEQNFGTGDPNLTCTKNECKCTDFAGTLCTVKIYASSSKQLSSESWYMLQRLSNEIDPCFDCGMYRCLVIVLVYFVGP